MSAAWFRKTLSVMLLAAAAAGCATAPPVPPVSENLLAEAGFKTIAARSEPQQQHLQSLPQDVVSEMQQTGRHYYVYPDVGNKRLYVGTPKEYQQYLALRTRYGLPNPPPPNTTGADMQQYLKRDAAMVSADAQKVETYPWTIWPDFAIVIDWTR